MAMVLLLLDGSMSLMALGATKVEVSMKKISSRNTKSDMDEELKVGSTLFLDLIAIARPWLCGFVQDIHKLSRLGFKQVDDFLNLGGDDGVEEVGNDADNQTANSGHHGFIDA